MSHHAYRAIISKATQKLTINGGIAWITFMTHKKHIDMSHQQCKKRSDTYTITTDAIRTNVKLGTTAAFWTEPALKC